MRDDVAVLISRAKARGAAFRIRDGRVEVQGLAHLPEELAGELEAFKGDVLRHLVSQDETAVREKAPLLAWAAGLAEQNTVLSSPVRYVEAKSRVVATRRPSWYAVHYLNIMTHGRLQRTLAGWGRANSVWWQEREDEAMQALTALKGAMESQGRVSVRS